MPAPIVKQRDVQTCTLGNIYDAHAKPPVVPCHVRMSVPLRAFCLVVRLCPSAHNRRQIPSSCGSSSQTCAKYVSHASPDSLQAPHCPRICSSCGRGVAQPDTGRHHGTGRNRGTGRERCSRSHNCDCRRANGIACSHSNRARFRRCWIDTCAPYKAPYRDTIPCRARWTSGAQSCATEPAEWASSTCLYASNTADRRSRGGGR